MILIVGHGIMDRPVKVSRDLFILAVNEQGARSGVSTPSRYYLKNSIVALTRPQTEYRKANGSACSNGEKFKIFFGYAKSMSSRHNKSVEGIFGLKNV